MSGQGYRDISGLRWALGDFYQFILNPQDEDDHFYYLVKPVFSTRNGVEIVERTSSNNYLAGNYLVKDGRDCYWIKVPSGLHVMQNDLQYYGSIGYTGYPSRYDYQWFSTFIAKNGKVFYQIPPPEEGDPFREYIVGFSIIPAPEPEEGEEPEDAYCIFVTLYFNPEVMLLRNDALSLCMRSPSVPYWPVVGENGENYQYKFYRGIANGLHLEFPEQIHLLNDSHLLCPRLPWFFSQSGLQCIHRDPWSGWRFEGIVDVEAGSVALTNSQFNDDSEFISDEVITPPTTDDPHGPLLFNPRHQNTVSSPRGNGSETVTSIWNGELTSASKVLSLDIASEDNVGNIYNTGGLNSLPYYGAEQYGLLGEYESINAVSEIKRTWTGTFSLTSSTVRYFNEAETETGEYNFTLLASWVDVAVDLNNLEVCSGTVTVTKSSTFNSDISPYGYVTESRSLTFTCLTLARLGENKEVILTDYCSGGYERPGLTVTVGATTDGCASPITPSLATDRMSLYENNVVETILTDVGTYNVPTVYIGLNANLAPRNDSYAVAKSFDVPTDGTLPYTYSYTYSKPIATTTTALNDQSTHCIAEDFIGNAKVKLFWKTWRESIVSNSYVSTLISRVQTFTPEEHTDERTYAASGTSGSTSKIHQLLLGETVLYESNYATSYTGDSESAYTKTIALPRPLAFPNCDYYWLNPTEVTNTVTETEGTASVEGSEFSVLHIDIKNSFYILLETFYTLGNNNSVIPSSSELVILLNGIEKRYELPMKINNIDAEGFLFERTVYTSNVEEQYQPNWAIAAPQNGAVLYATAFDFSEINKFPADSRIIVCGTLTSLPATTNPSSPPYPVEFLNSTAQQSIAFFFDTSQFEWTDFPTTVTVATDDGPAMITPEVWFPIDLCHI